MIMSYITSAGQLVETNLDSTNWRAIRVATERVESGVINKNNIDDEFLKQASLSVCLTCSIMVWSLI